MTNRWNSEGPVWRKIQYHGKRRLASAPWTYKKSWLKNKERDITADDNTDSIIVSLERMDSDSGESSVEGDELRQNSSNAESWLGASGKW
jgi:hypothetical protein